jgi:hypothetical protein
MRLSYPKSDPMNYTAKILLNSLYGRFGMDGNFNTSKIIDKKEFNKLLKSNYDIDNITELGNKFLVSYNENPNYLKYDYDINKKDHNINISLT